MSGLCYVACKATGFIEVFDSSGRSSELGLGGLHLVLESYLF